MKDKKFYIGYSENLENRIKEHNKGKVTSTKYRRPLKLIYYEVFTVKNDAKSREIFIKSGFGRKQLRISLKRTVTKYIKSEG